MERSEVPGNRLMDSASVFVHHGLVLAKGSTMKKLRVIGLIGAVALFAIAKQTSVFSYVKTGVAQLESDVKGQIPTKFELDRIRNEIAALDGDVGQMIKPIAEYKAVIEKMRRDIVKTQANIDEQKKNMLPIVEQ